MGGSGGKTRKGPADKRIFVSNLPYEMKWQEVKDLFRQEVGEVAYVELFNDESGKPRGAGVMEFPTQEMAKLAIDKMHRFDYKGRKIVVKEDFDAERDKFGRIIGRSGGGGGDRGGRDDRRGGHGDMGGGGGHHGGHGGGGHGVDMGNTYGLSPQFLASLNITGPLHTRIFVANMDYTVDERKLKEVFRLAGRVVGVELQRDKEGKSRGFAVVVYDHPVEAVQAISMLNNQQLFDRKLSVRFDKVEPDPPRRSDRLPEGLHGVGMGLGVDGQPLHDVRENLPSPADMGNIGAAPNMGPSNAANVGTAALQAALATIMGMGGMGGAAGGAGNMGPGAGMGGAGGMGGMSNNGGGMGNMDRGMGAPMDRGMGGPMDRGMGGPTAPMDRGIGGPLDRGMGGPSGPMDRGMGGPMDRGMGGPMDRSPMSGPSDRSMGGSMDRGMGGPGPMDRGMSGPMDRGMGGAGSMDRNLDGGMGGMSGSMGGMGGPGSHGAMGPGPSGSGMGGGGGFNSPSNGGWSGGQQGGGGGGGLQARSDKIVVKGLAESCTWHTLKDRFSHAGDIKFAEMKDRGTGVIRFGSERDAERAVAMMNGQRIDGRTVTVGLYL